MRVMVRGKPFSELSFLRTHLHFVTLEDGLEGREGDCWDMAVNNLGGV